MKKKKKNALTMLKSTSLIFKNNETKIFLFLRIYSGAQITVKEAGLLLSTFSIRHGLSEVAQNDLFKLILLFCPITHIIPNSFYKLMKKTMPKDIVLTNELYCQKCNNKLDNLKNCSIVSCKNFLKKQTSYDSFTYVNMDNQLKDIIFLQHRNIIKAKTMKRRFVDILDGEKYRNNCLTERENTLNLIVYTDGVQLTNSSKIEVWPIACSIIELPPIIRNSVANKLIFGLWCGKQKPDSDILFEKFIDYIQNLNLNGLEISVDNKVIKFYFNLYGFLSDSPARSLSIKINQHNGYNSCPFCEIKGWYKKKNIIVKYIYIYC